MSGSPVRFGPYELVHRLGAGGMAETFLAVRRGPGGFEQRVCIKRILPAFETDGAFVRQFLEEARVSAQLRHANVAQVLDFGIAEGSHYLALELVEGMDLYRLLRALEERGETMTSGLVVFLANELGTALDYAHHMATTDGPVVHRDISPSNVLVSRAGEVKLTDFGIAKAATKSGKLTTTGVVKGKVPYMAPEYALSGRFDPRGDLFALGVLLFEALAGRRPFVGVTDLDTLHRIQTGQRPALAELCPTAPPALVAAIEKLLAANPDERFQSASELLDALVDDAPPPTARRILGDLVRRLGGGSLPPEASLPIAPRASTTPLAPKDAPAADRVPFPAGAADPTRTRPPVADDAPPTSHAPPPPAAPPPSSDLAHTATVVGPRLAAELTDPARDARAGEPLTTPRPIETQARDTAPPRAALGPRVAIALSLGALAGLAIAVVVAVALPRSDPPAAAPTAAAAPPPRSDSPRDPVPEPEPEPVPDPAASATAPDPAPSEQTPTSPPRHGARTSTTTARTPDPARAPVPARVPDPVPVPVSAPDPVPVPDPAPVRAPEPRAPGSLRVVVMPFGEVWIDGEHVGSSPVTRSVAAGSHVVEAGASRSGPRTMRRSVDVAPGRQESVVLR